MIVQKPCVMDTLRVNIYVSHVFMILFLFSFIHIFQSVNTIDLIIIIFIKSVDCGANICSCPLSFIKRITQALSFTTRKLGF